MVSWIITAFFYLAIPALPFLVQASEQSPGPHQVLVKTEVSKEAEYPLRVKGVLLIECGPEVVWGVLTDYEHLEGVFPRLVESRVLSRGTEEVVVEQRYQGLMFLSKSMVFVNRETPMRRIDFRREGGKSGVKGYWSLEPVAEGSTLLTLEVFVRPRRFLMWFMKGMLESHVPRGLISIRQKSLSKTPGAGNPEDPETVYLKEGQEVDPPQGGF